MTGLLEKLGFEVDADLRPFASKMKEAGVVAGNAAKTMGQRFLSANDKLGAMATKVGAVAALIGGVAVKSAASFEQNMARARTMTDLTNQEWEQLVKNVQAASGDLGITDFALQGEAVFQAFSTGSDSVEDATADITDAFRNYVAQGTEVGTTLGFIAQQQTIFGDAAGSNTEILDRLANATIKAQSTQESMAKAMAETGPLAKAAGLSADELAGTLATLTQTTGSAATAGTAFKGLLNALLTPTAAQEDILRQMNDAIRAQIDDLAEAEKVYGSVDAALGAMGKRTIEFGQAGVQAAGGFFPFINDLSLSLGEADFETRRIAESMEGYSAILALTSDNGVKLGENVGFITSETGRLDKQLGYMQDTASNAFGKLVSELKVFGSTLLEDSGFLDDFKVSLQTGASLLRDLTGDMREWIEANPDAVEQIKQQIVGWAKLGAVVLVASKGLSWLADIGQLVTSVLLAGAPLIKLVSKLWALVLVPAVQLAGKALLALGTGPLGAIVGAITLVGGTLALFVDDWGALWNDVVEIVEGVVDTLAFLWDSVVEIITSLGGAIFDAITYPFQAAADFVVDLWEDVLAFFSDAFNSVTGFFGFGAGQGFAGGGPVLGFAAGGYVPSTGGPSTDSVAAKLTPGEFVINEPSARVLGPEFLESANQASETGAKPGAGGETHLHFEGMTDRNWIREVLVPEIERVQSRGLGPLERSVL